MPQLIISEPACDPVALDLRETLVVGRDKQNPLSLVHQPISRQHAVFEPDADGWTVRDLGSANGTFVNGIRIRKHALSDGDVVNIGPVKLVYREEAQAEILLTQAKLDVTTLELDPSNKRLGLMYEITRAMGAIEEHQRLVERIPEMLLRIVGCERVMLALTDKAGRDVVQRIVRTQGENLLTNDVIVSRVILQAVLERREGVLIGKRQRPPNTLERQGISSAMCVPIETAWRLYGFVYADDRHREIQPEDLEFFRVLGRLVGTMLENAERVDRLQAMADAASGHGPLHEISGCSPAVQKLRVQIAKVATAPSSHVLIRGESGVGKERVARALHKASSRANQVFVAVHCAAILDTMIESVLFGYEKGAFIGAEQSRRGQFVLADGGTLFLDEIGDLSLSAQAKVLRVLQEGELLPLGAETPIRVDVRVFASTQKNLQNEVAEGRFRKDLYYRVNVLEIEVPPLRERASDIELLATMFLQAAALNLGKRLQSFSPPALLALQAHSWPGNLRELKNEVERGAVYAEDSVVKQEDLSSILQQTSRKEPLAVQEASPAMRFAALEPMERALVEEALQASRGNLAEAARLLGITRIMMRRRVEKFGLRYKDVE